MSEAERSIDVAGARLSISGAVALLTGADLWSLRAEPRLGLRALRTSDGPAGVRGGGWNSGETALLLPCGSALGATWDPALVEQLGMLLGDEARRASVDILLAPTLNLHRTPFAGRAFECFSEDPFLTGALGGAFVRGVQAKGVAAVPKHFVANDSETKRLTVDVVIDPTALHDVYLRPFQAAVAAGAWGMMSAYNGVNGSQMSDNATLLTGVLKEDWAFDGVVISDWGAVRTCAESALAGVDLVMPGPDGPWGDALAAAVADGRVPARVVADKLDRLVRLSQRTDRGADVPPARSGADRALLRRAAARAMTLLRNRDVLPLDPGALSRIALIGPAQRLTIQGGGSAHVEPDQPSDFETELRRRFPASDIACARGARGHRLLREPAMGAVSNPRTGQPGFSVEIVDEAGSVLRTEHRDTSNIVLPPLSPTHGIAAGGTRVIIAFDLRATSTGLHRIGLAGLGDYHVSLDGGPEEQFTLARDPARPPLFFLYGRQHVVERHLSTGATCRVRIVAEVNPRYGWAALRIGHEEPEGDEDALIADARRIAEQSDVALIMVGDDDDVESEAYDRSSLGLPGAQDRLIEAVAAVARRTVVIVNAGAPVLMPWQNRVDAILHVWFPGLEGGAALAEIVAGVTEPGGRLPMVFSGSDGVARLPAPWPSDGRLDYGAQPLFGQRALQAAGVEPAFPLGHGLGYTDWRYDDVRAVASDRLAVTVTNVGPRAGREVVQVYGTPPDGSPAMLVGFTSVEAEPGAAQQCEIQIELPPSAHGECNGWRFDVGRSATDLRLAAEIGSLVQTY